MQESALTPAQDTGKFKFYRDAVRFVIVLGLLSIAGFVVSIVFLLRANASTQTLVMHSLDLLTIVVPPALPMAMTVGTAFALYRLKRADVYCTSPLRVNVCGKVKIVCFDKTGTLTEDSLDVLGIHCSADGAHSLLDATPNAGAGVIFSALTGAAELSSLPPSAIVCGIASCHSLSSIGPCRLVGDPLDVKMFQAIGWDLVDEVAPPPPPTTTTAPAVGPIAQDSAEGGSAADSLEQHHARAYGRPETASAGVHIDALRHMHFASELQRAGVVVRIVRDLDRASVTAVIVKGAPEMVRTLCDPSTIPADFDAVLHAHLRDGHRVLAIAGRRLPSNTTATEISKTDRRLLEHDLAMYGLLVMRNSLKPQTPPVIAELNRARVRMIMITGDNALTAASVARECGLVDRTSRVFLGDLPGADATEGASAESPAATGSAACVQWRCADEADTAAWRLNPCTLLPEPRVASAQQAAAGPHAICITGPALELVRCTDSRAYERLLVAGHVFARMRPNDKTRLVEDLQQIGYVAAMVGDGANDCGALKAAFAGISLSEAEASVAAPFTFKRQTVECVPLVIREGRCALMSSFAMFKFMALYSLIQFISVIILYFNNNDLSDWEFLYVDLFNIIVLAALMGRTEAAPTLLPKRPPGSLLSPVILSSLFLQAIGCFAFQVGAYVWAESESRFRISDTLLENTAVYSVSVFQYLAVCLSFMLSRGYRKPFWTNRLFTAATLLLLLLSMYIVFFGDPLLRNAFGMALLCWQAAPGTPCVPASALLVLGFQVISNLVTLWAMELLLVPAVVAVHKRIRHGRHGYRPRNRYKQIMAEIAADAAPPTA